MLKGAVLESEHSNPKSFIYKMLAYLSLNFKARLMVTDIRAAVTLAGRGVH